MMTLGLYAMVLLLGTLSLLVVGVFCAVADYRIQKLEKGSIGIEPYGDSATFSFLAAFGISMLTVVLGKILAGETTQINLGYVFVVVYIATLPTFEMVLRLAARAREPRIKFKKFLWMKH